MARKKNPYPFRENAKNRLFHLFEFFRLVRGAWVHNYQLENVAGIAFNQRLQEMVKDGAIIHRKLVNKNMGDWKYRCTRLP